MRKCDGTTCAIVCIVPPLSGRVAGMGIGEDEGEEGSVGEGATAQRAQPCACFAVAPESTHSGKDRGENEGAI